jgi:2'-5' RNA ligase
MDKRLFVVALCEGELKNRALLLQKIFAEKYQIYKRLLPPLHITLEVVYAPDNRAIEGTVEAIKKATQSIGPFAVKSKGFTCFPPPYKSIGLLIEKNHELDLAVTKIRSCLEENKVLVANPFGQNWIFHLTLVNTFLADRKWSDAEFFTACNLVENVPLDVTGEVERIEIWHPTKEQETMNEGSFKLLRREATISP